MSAPDNTTVAADLVPQITIDYMSKFRNNIDELQRVLGISQMQRVPEGNAIKVYAISQHNTPNQVGEGEQVALTEIKRTVAKTIDMTLKKYRKTTTAEAIQKVGIDVAINQTDDKFLSGIQKAIKTDFFNSVKTGTGTVTAASTLQMQLALNNAKLEVEFEDVDLDPIHFVHPNTVAAYLGSASIVTQNTFGMRYIEDFLGLGTVVITPNVSANDAWSTNKSNLAGAYVPMDTSDLAAAMGIMTEDETGIIGIKHSVLDDYVSVQTLALTDVVFFPEVLGKVFKGTVNPI